MDSSSCVRTRMLEQAARLLEGTNNEDAWHLVELFQYTQPSAFIHICHRILATFLELTHDHFEHGWPIQTRLGPMSAAHERRQWSRKKTVSASLIDNTSHCDYCDTYMNQYAFPPVIQSESRKISLTRTPTSSALISPQLTQFTASSQGETNHFHYAARLKVITPKRLFKQLLPSKPRAPNGPNGRAGTKVSCFDLGCARTPARLHDSNRVEDASTSGEPPSVLSPSSVNPTASLRLPASVVPNELMPPSPINVDSIVCHCLIDYLLESPDICSAEGLFRVPGNSQRIRSLWLQLKTCLQPTYVRFPEPTPLDENTPSPSGYSNVWSLLSRYSPYDLASLLLRCLASCTRSRGSNKQILLHLFQDEADSSTSGLIPPQLSDLCFQATRLQYTLGKGSDKDPKLIEDWIPILCQARQLLTYRIVLQFLLPEPERLILLNLLRLFRRIAKCSSKSRMSPECLARCTAVAVFGSPHSLTKTTEHLAHTEPDTNPLRWRIDTLSNLIQMADQLDQLPGLVYMAVRNRLRCHFGHSPGHKLQMLAPVGVKSGEWITPTEPWSCPKRTRCTLEDVGAESNNSPICTEFHWSQCTNLGVSELMGDAGSVRLQRTKSSLELDGRATTGHPKSTQQPSEMFKGWRRQKAAATEALCQINALKHRSFCSLYQN
ncbi:unnamed protein product [Dicrocoelium dendriticum]|nr:unnamed protein product [Dicrocoelium dendriticum]